ncbi:MAG: SoxR reducing system RseC family protein [Eubacteriales bacterium]|nr:SoxR reducing system RseC family protein [Eubacteriales bacterium]
MKQTAKVTSSQGATATVEVKRPSACAGCARSGSCLACGKIVTATARNDIGALPGDTVSVESSSSRIIAYAAAVFVLPIAAGLALFYILSALLPDGGAVIYTLSTLLFVFVFAAACIVLNRFIKRNPDITITEILREDNNSEQSE